MISRIELLRADDWASFKLDLFRNREEYRSYERFEADTEASDAALSYQQRRATKLIQAGELGSAMRMLCESQERAPPNMDTFRRLFSKHPPAVFFFFKHLLFNFTFLF
jgi:hypothetical protein